MKKPTIFKKLFHLLGFCVQCILFMFVILPYDREHDVTGFNWSAYGPVGDIMAVFANTIVPICYGATLALLGYYVFRNSMLSWLQYVLTFICTFSMILPVNIQCLGFGIMAGLTWFVYKKSEYVGRYT